MSQRGDLSSERGREPCCVPNAFDIRGIVKHSDVLMRDPGSSVRHGTRCGRFLVLLACLASVRAHAGAPEEAAFREQYLRASKLYAAKDYAGAIPILQAAYALQPAPQLLYNIGQAYRRLGQWSSARVYFEMYAALSRDLTPEARAALESALQEARDSEQAQRRPEVIEKTRTLVIQEEKPLPRWLRPVGIVTSLSGLGIAAAGGALWGIDGQCASAATPPATQCAQVYNSDTLGVALTVTGAGLFALGAVPFGLSFRRPTRSQKRVDSDAQLEEPLLVPPVRVAGEPPPAGWNVDGTQIEPPPAGWDAQGKRLRP